MSKGKPEYHLFYGGPFSQWAASDFEVNGIKYNCAEQYMMAQKARLFGDEVRLERIMRSDNPAEQKALGKKVARFRKNVWEAVARDVVMRGSLAKFTQSKAFLQDLMATEGMLLVEASPTDVIWGIGLAEWDPDAHDPTKWRGTNWLGEVLTDLRERLLDVAVVAFDATHGVRR
jgi:ribA/ribD-fused uncharacterized protein